MGISAKVTLLILGVVIAIFLTVAMLGVWVSGTVDSQMEVSRELTGAAEKANELKAATGAQHQLVSELITGNAAISAAVADSLSRQDELIKQSISYMDHVPGGVSSLEALKETTESISRLVREDVSSALAAGDTAALERQASRLNDLHDSQEEGIDRLASQVQQAQAGWKEEHDRFMARANLIQLIATGAATLVALMLGLFVAKRLRKRLKGISRGVEALASGEMDVRVELGGNDEISVLAAGFNRMAAVIESTTDKLREEQNQVRSIHQAITDGIIVYDEKGRITSANPAAEAAVGMLERDMKGMSVTGIPEIDSVVRLRRLVPEENMVRCWEEKECTHPECPSFNSGDRQCWLQCGTCCHNEIQGTFSQKRDACERCDIYMRNGIRNVEFEKDGRYYTAAISPILGDDGEEVGRMALLHDITDIKVVEETLRSRNMELIVLNEVSASLSQNIGSLDVVIREALQRLMDAIGVRAGVIVTMDEKGEDLRIRGSVGLSTQTEVFMGLLPPRGILDVDRDGNTGLLDTGQFLARWKAIVPMLKKEGLRDPKVVPIDSDGIIMGMLMVADDQKDSFATDELRMLRAAALQFGIAIKNADLLKQLDNATHTWETTFNAMAEGIYVLDADRNIIQANMAMAEILGVPLNRIVGRKCYEVTHKTRCPIDLCPFEEAMEGRTGGTLEREERSLGKTFRISVNPIRDRGGAVVGAVHVMADITETNRLRDQLLQSDKMAAVGQLVAGVAHELNNPLTGILGYSQLLLRRFQDMDQATVKDLEAVIGEAERATRIVQNLLSFSRKHKPMKTVTDLNRAVRDLVELREYELKVNNIEVVTELDESLPRTMADVHQLEQVLLNLVNNSTDALRGRKDGVITIATSSDGRFIKVAVSDNGAGIAPEDLPRVFDPFFTTKEVGQGTGLGLSICYGIIEEHGGTIEIDSRPGEGTRVEFTVPIVSEVEEDGQAVSHPRRDESGGKRQVLLVDNEPAIIELLSDILTMDGYGVDVVENCSAALKKLSQEPYDSVITDVCDRRCGSEELYRRIREIDPELAANVIFILDDDEDDGRREYLDQEAKAYLVKPFELNSLRDSLRKVMKSNG